MIEMNIKIKFLKVGLNSRKLSMISLEVDLVNIYYNIFNNTAIIYIHVHVGILQYLIAHT